LSTDLAAIHRRLWREALLKDGSDLAPAEADRTVRDVTADSRRAGPGVLFCAVRGSARDSHDYLPAVAAAGAVAAIVERRAGNDPPQMEVTDGRLAAAFAAAEFFGDPWADMVLVGITGTNGKTTSAAILRHLLSADVPAGSIGTLGAVGADGRVIPGTEGLTTPGPVELARWLRRFADEGVRAVVLEVSSHALEQQRAAAARFDAVMFTNLSRDHLDYHGTIESYRAAKLRLVDLLKPDGIAVINADDPAWSGVGSRAPRAITYGISADADVTAEDVKAGPTGLEWLLRTPNGATDVSLPLYGMYNISNALGAAAVAWGLGGSIEGIARLLATLPQVPGRLERVPGPDNEATVLIDYAHTPDALERALAAVRPLVAGRLIVLFGAGGDRDHGKRSEMGRVAATLADLSFITSDNPRGESADAIAADIESGMGDAPRHRLIDRRDAIAAAIEAASAGDLILLAGKGHETYQIWGDERRPFDERVIVGEIFSGRGAKK
jgi:UDP-N-acetylmuramoyl-L-alanyl-D-glutamate--2,6-diaminopimelate ligase